MQEDHAVDLDWTAVEQEVAQKPQNAQLKLGEDRRSYEILEAVPGVSFDREQAAQALEAAPEGGDTSVELTFQKPEISAKQLKKRLFRDDLGSYTTNVSGTADRISNVRLAAEKCDGIILCPGDEFSYNETLGERTAENGFKKAGAYLNGETVQELGGGICQVSSTMYAAALDADLNIVERHNHTFASSYIGLGMDATVSWGGPDFRISNNREDPIRVEARYSDGRATVTFWGTRTDKRSVKMTSETLETIPYTTVRRSTSGLKKGKTSVTQEGSDGYRVQTYKEVYDDGVLVSREKEALSVYSPHQKIISVGSGKKKKKKSKKSKAVAA
jgi:vancomycin resistance protein YoaR